MKEQMERQNKELRKQQKFISSIQKMRMLIENNDEECELK